MKLQEVDILKGAWVDPAAGRGTLRDFAESWITRRPSWRPTTRARVKMSLDIHVLPVLGDRPLASLPRSDFEDLIAGLTLSPSTVRIVHQHVCSMMGAAVDEGRIVRNPAVGIDLPEVVKAPIIPLAVDEVWRLFDAAPAHFKLVVMLGAGLGLRQGEALGLTIDRVDFLNRRVRIDRQLVNSTPGPAKFGPPKTKSSNRVIPAPSVVLDALSSHLIEHGEGPDRLFVHAANGTQISRSSFGDLWRMTAKGAGLPNTRHHDLRHHFASTLIASGCSIKAVQEALGHASAKETLDTYSHLFPADHDRIRGAIEATLVRPAESWRNAESV